MVSKLQTLTAFWKEFNVPEVQKSLDEIAMDITQRQDDSDAARRALIELIRNFKKENSEETRQIATPMIKSFQNEVDSLAKRSKAAEKAFFDVYRKMADIADPVPILEHALESQKSLSKLQDFEIETRQLRETMADYNKEIQEYKVKEKKMHELQTKVDMYDKNIDSILQQRVNEATAKIEEQFREKERTIEEEKHVLDRKMQDQEAKVKQLQRQLEESQSELFKVQSKTEEKQEAKSEEVEILLNDLEESNQRALIAEREVEVLKEQLLSVRESSVERETSEAKEMDTDMFELKRELSCKAIEVEHLLADVTKLTARCQKDEDEMQKSAAQFDKETTDLRKTIQSLELKLERQADYENIKKDLAILKSLEFSQDTEDVDNEKRPLEVMILERSKVLQSENSTLRMDKDRLEADLRHTRQQLGERTKEVEKQQSLITELEDHVERLQELSTVNRGEAEGRSSTDILVDALEYDDDVKRAAMNSSPSNGDGSLLPIVQAQRERFRARNEELEAEQEKQVQQIGVLQKEVQDLQADNVKLYEKIRFLQSFRSSSGGDAVINVESRYKNQYEQRLDPFSSFSAQERQRRVGQLNVVEKIILSMVQFMLSNKVARLFVFGYSVLVHVLVFMVLMSMAYSDSYRRDLAAEWHDKYLQHMQDVHGHGDQG